MTNTLNIAIAGLGTVGVGVYKIITEQAELLQKRCGAELRICAVSARDKDKDRGIDISNLTWYDNAIDMFDDANADIVVEAIGGIDGVPYGLVIESLKCGKHVVTANKALIATYGLDLAQAAQNSNVALMFEAAVAGGIPIVKTLREGLAANNYQRISGILNGTCNYILSSMAKDRRSFHDVLKEAQDLGYAETPPDLDIDGVDTAHKLAIITSLAYGTKVNLAAVYCEGIRNISLEDITYANELGYVIKLLGICKQGDNGIEQRVHPCLVAKDSPMAGVGDCLNAVQIECDSFGQALITGAGAGAGPTASSIVADIMDIAAGRISPPFGYDTAALEEGKFIDINSHEGEYYIRINVKDEVGVLAAITSVLGEQKIGVEKVIQSANKQGRSAQIALTTHVVKEQDIQNALGIINAMDSVVDTPHMIRVE